MRKKGVKNYPRVILAGTHSGVGKTTITAGIMLALRKRGFTVQPFKTGPDYIDPTYHTQICGNICRNLDTWLLDRDVILELFQRQAKKADVSIIEGVMGLYDGLKDNETGSTAHLAKILAAGVILIVDARSISRSAAACVLGYEKFDPRVNIQGVILNNIAGSVHYHSIKSAVEAKTKIPVLGFLPEDSCLRLPERHLGLIPAEEKKILADFKKKLLSLVEKNIDVGKIIRIIRQAKKIPQVKKNLFNGRPVHSKVTIAVARDQAFNFYYQDNLDILKHLGAKLVEFSPLRDKKLPSDIESIYIGGGFPELFASELSKNTTLRKDIYQRARDGMPVYAECGGLMYLVKSLVDFKNKAFPMVGIFNVVVCMDKRRRALGYVNIKTLQDNIISNKTDTNKAHMFHWSYIDNKKKAVAYCYQVTKDKGKVSYDGLIRENILASYTHIHFGTNINLAKKLINACKTYKKRKGKIQCRKRYQE